MQQIKYNSPSIFSCFLGVGGGVGGGWGGEQEDIDEENVSRYTQLPVFGLRLRFLFKF